MPTLLSPGVTWQEIDLTTIIPSVSTTTGAFAGDFEWGPIDHIWPVPDEIALVRWFYRPTANNFQSWFTAANFLSYSNDLQVVRAANTQVVKNSTNGSTTLLIKNKDDYELNYMDLSSSNSVGMFAAKYAGTVGDSLKVSVWASSNSAAYAGWTYSEYFNGAPGTSEWTRSRGGANDEMHIIVIDEDGKFSGVANTVLERFGYLSKASDAKNDDGSSNYYVQVISDKSEYIYIVNHAQNTTTQVVDTHAWGNTATGTSFTELTQKEYTGSLTGGVYVPANDAALINAYSKFLNTEEVDISLVMSGPANTTVSEAIIDDLVTVRKDCISFHSPLMSDVVNNAGMEAEDIVATRNEWTSTSYAVMDSQWKYQFDKYNNTYRWVPVNGDIAGLCARTDHERDAWWSPAGFNRGQLKNVSKLAWKPGQQDRDTLYKNGINPVLTFKGEGPILYGDKTMLTKPSAFDRINVRRLFIVLEKAISKAAKYSLFEFNDEFTRASFTAMVEPYLRDIKGRRGIYDFRVVCDETNNTPEVIDRNEFIGDIYIKPARSINFIYLNFIAVRTGVAFSEVIGRW